jgi:CBS domain containing-hemolysin-like protein
MTAVLAVLAVIVLLFLGAVASLLEYTFTRLGRARAAGLDEGERRHESALTEVVADRERFLGPLSLIRLASNAGVVAIVVITIGSRWSGFGAFVGFVVAVLVMAVVDTGIPRRLSIEQNDRMALSTEKLARRVAGFLPLRLIASAVSRLVRGLTPSTPTPDDAEVSEDELLALAEAFAEADVIESAEASLIESIIELGDTVVREVMVPRPDMVTVDDAATVTEALRRALAHGYTRLPVCGADGIDDVVGVVLTKDMTAAHLDERGDELVVTVHRSPMFVPETKRVAELMREMQGSKAHMAVVVDEYGGTAGLITLEDIIEELVGEITDEFDEDTPLVEDLGAGGLRVSGRMSIDDFSALVGGELPEGDWDTVGGLVFDLLGHVPREGESVVCDGHQLTAERVLGRRIALVLVTPTPALAAE